MRALPDPAFAFADFVFVPKERLLLRDGVPVPLTAKAFDLLAILVQRSGHLVSKDELFEEVWPNTTVQETNLTVNISALRKVLGGGRKGSEFIQTVPGRGYRFVAPVLARQATPALLPAEPADNNSGAAPKPELVANAGFGKPFDAIKHRGWTLIAVALVCVAIGAVALWRAKPQTIDASSARWPCCLSSVIARVTITSPTV
jgi:DNA-binding winged helix-turn-helix (wHTH) protein